MRKSERKPLAILRNCEDPTNLCTNNNTIFNMNIAFSKAILSICDTTDIFEEKATLKILISYKKNDILMKKKAQS